MDIKYQKYPKRHEIMTLNEVADYLKISEKTVLRMVHNNKIPCVKVAGQWRFIRTVIDDWLMSKMKVVPKQNSLSFNAWKYCLLPLSHIVRKDFIILDMRPGTKKEVLLQLIEPLLENGLMLNREELLHKLMKREEMMSTAVGNGVAFPHMRNPNENPTGNPLLCIGVCKPGTNFEALDRGKTHLFFLLYTDNEIVHLRLMAQLSYMLRKKNIVSRFTKARTKEEIIHIIVNENQEILSS